MREIWKNYFDSFVTIEIMKVFIEVKEYSSEFRIFAISEVCISVILSQS